MKPFIHETATVEDGVHLGDNVKIWHDCHIRSGCSLDNNVSIGKGSYIDQGVHIGQGCRVQNGVNVYSGVKLEDWCFIGPAVVFTNDQFPRVGNTSWKVMKTFVRTGASIGAGSVIRCGIELGHFSMIGAGAIVTKNVAPFTLVLGLPAIETNKICACGQTTLDLSSSYSECLRDCCKERMSSETYKIASETINTLVE
ncbi:MAG: acetyltransferase-like isoleucine patch superfamily enzyme [Bacteriovoracaceae bacterium]|jgi:acetyltransferase-like isoleucine patch superfamily enzyme